MGEASTTGPRAESREPAGSELQSAALGLVLDPFLIVRSAVLGLVFTLPCMTEILVRSVAE